MAPHLAPLMIRGTCYRARARSVLRRQRLRAVQRGPLDQPGGASMITASATGKDQRTSRVGSSAPTLRAWCGGQGGGR